MLDNQENANIQDFANTFRSFRQKSTDTLNLVASKRYITAVGLDGVGKTGIAKLLTEEVGDMAVLASPVRFKDPLVAGNRRIQAIAHHAYRYDKLGNDYGYVPRLFMMGTSIGYKSTYYPLHESGKTLVTDSDWWKLFYHRAYNLDLEGGMFMYRMLRKGLLTGGNTSTSGIFPGKVISIRGNKSAGSIDLEAEHIQRNLEVRKEEIGLSASDPHTFVEILRGLHAIDVVNEIMDELCTELGGQRIQVANPYIQDTQRRLDFQKELVRSILSVDNK